MERISRIEQEHQFLLPESYKNLLAKFELFMELEYINQAVFPNGVILIMMNKNTLTEAIRKPYQGWQYVRLWASEDARIQNHAVPRHDIDGATIDAEHLKNSFLFAQYADGGRLYFDLADNMSVWAYWLDDGSVGKIADSFDDIFKHSTIIDSE